MSRRPLKVRPLNTREEAFVLHYVVTRNATEAAKRAGYSPRSAKNTGYDLLQRDAIQAAVAAADAEIAERVTAARTEAIDAVAQGTTAWLDEIDVLAHSNIRHYVLADDGQVALREGAPETAWRAVQSVELTVSPKGERKTKLRLWPKTDALRMKGDHLGLFKQRVEHTGADGGPVELKVSYSNE